MIWIKPSTIGLHWMGVSLQFARQHAPVKAERKAVPSVWILRCA